MEIRYGDNPFAYFSVLKRNPTGITRVLVNDDALSVVFYELCFRESKKRLELSDWKCDNLEIYGHDILPE
jgi:hypothetical protein